MALLMDGLTFAESPRWHDGKLWVSDWGARQLVVIDSAGGHELVPGVDSFPMCIDFLPDGRLLIVDSAHQQLLCRTPDGSQTRYADLSPLSSKPWNDIVVGEQGHAYVNNIGYDFPGGTPTLGTIALVTSDGVASEVADGLAFPNGMAITPDGATLIVAESHADRLTAFDIAPDGTLGGRRMWAATPNEHPDGICMDSEGAIWFADVAGQRCVRVREGGEVLGTIALDRGAFACVLSRGDDPQLYVVGQHWGGAAEEPSGQVFGFPAPFPGAGRP